MKTHLFLDKKPWISMGTYKDIENLDKIRILIRNAKNRKDKIATEVWNEALIQTQNRIVEKII